MTYKKSLQLRYLLYTRRFELLSGKILYDRLNVLFLIVHHLVLEKKLQYSAHLSDFFWNAIKVLYMTFCYK